MEGDYTNPSLVNAVSSIVRVQTKQADKNGRRTVEGHEFGTNPCSEIILPHREFCNLSEVVVRASDTPKSLLKRFVLQQS